RWFTWSPRLTAAPSTEPARGLETGYPRGWCCPSSRTAAGYPRLSRVNSGASPFAGAAPLAGPLPGQQHDPARAVGHRPHRRPGQQYVAHAVRPDDQYALLRPATLTAG